MQNASSFAWLWLFVLMWVTAIFSKYIPGKACFVYFYGNASGYHFEGCLEYYKAQSFRYLIAMLVTIGTNNIAYWLWWSTLEPLIWLQFWVQMNL